LWIFLSNIGILSIAQNLFLNLSNKIKDNMKETISLTNAMILLLVVTSGIVIANRAIRHIDKYCQTDSGNYNNRGDPAKTPPAAAAQPAAIAATPVHESIAAIGSLY
jgi:hypothetical protein